MFLTSEVREFVNNLIIAEINDEMLESILGEEGMIGDLESITDENVLEEMEKASVEKEIKEMLEEGAFNYEKINQFN